MHWAGALTVLKSRVQPLEEKAKSPYCCLQLPNGYGGKRALFYSEVHSERLQVLVGKWEIPNPVREEKKKKRLP